MTMTETITEHIGMLIVVLICLVVLFYIINHFTGGQLVRQLVCSTLFWIPFGAGASQYCTAVPV